MEPLARHIAEALENVRDLRRHILDRQRFRGYSGWARALSGCAALTAAAVLSTGWFPARATTHLVVWGLVFLFGLAINYGALAYWFFTDQRAEPGVGRLGPAADALPALLVGAVLTAALLRSRVLWPLYGTWMCLYGLANLHSRHALPPRILYVGLFYVFCGAIFLLSPAPHFLNPWPMGIVFFAGEWAGGLVLHFDGHGENA